MKVSRDWLKEFVDFDLPPEELAALLRGQGFDVASWIAYGGPVENVVTARVESVAKHPNADKLTLCKVFDGSDRLDVVCGAPNVAAGVTVPLARVGARLPDGTVIQKAVLRGQESSGMLCSARELGLGDDHSGLLLLSSDTPLGQDIAETLRLGDLIFDVEVTPNRPDVLSHWGVAREVAAGLKKKLRLPDAKAPRGRPARDLVRTEEKKLCARYIGRVIEGVTVKPSPLWMRLRLERCGVRAINNVVDATNYVLLELGHPLHAFDRDKLAGGSVTVRRGRAGETLPCLDDVARPMEGALVIADAEKPQALAGIIGGEPSAVRDGTARLLLESAHFEPSGIRRTRGRLNVSSESSYRFERGADQDMAELAGRRAAALILSLAGGRVTAEQDVRTTVPRPVTVTAGVDRVNGLLGTSFSAPAMRAALERLGFTVKAVASALKVTPPVHRHDVREDVDVAEEVVRLLGYDKVPARLRAAPVPPEPATAEQRLAGTARELLLGAGFFEAVNGGLVSRRAWEDWTGGPAPEAVELSNPLSLSGELLAPGLTLGLAINAQTNLRRGNGSPRFFETARAFRRGEGRVAERRALAWLAVGDSHGDHWREKPHPLEIWDMKTWVKNLLLEWRLAGARFESGGAPGFLHPGESQSVRMGESTVGFFGRIHPRRAAALDLPENAFLAELDLTALAGGRFLEARHAALPKHPALRRDLSLLFPDGVAWSSVVMHLMRAFEWLENVELFDVFSDASLPPGHRSLSFHLSFRHPERTLTDAEAADLQTKVLDELAAAFRARLRDAAGKDGGASATPA